MAVRKRIGALVPSTNTTAEGDYQLAAPAGVTIHGMRMWLTNEGVGSGEAMDAMNAEIASGAKYVPMGEETSVLEEFVTAKILKNKSLNLGFKKEDKTIGVPGLIIAEVKQERYNRDSPFIQAMKRSRIQPMRISKYCIGSVLLNNSTKNNLFKEQFKYNRFKPKILTLNKIEYGLDQ